ncbi:MAG TPA: AAA family ATPase [Phycisphaerales bacterium]|nr:AAA family ATPase [Phycisphaerales bacterium]
MSLIRTIDITTRPTERLLRACATFGLAVRPTASDLRPTFTAIARELHARFRPGDIVLIQGPSGSGKSTLLGELARLSRSNGHNVITGDSTPPHPETALIDLIDLPLDGALRTLAHAGLADATMLSRSAYQLSEGERFRLRLAQALASVQQHHAPVTLIIDEFASVLDRATARCLCYALRRLMGAVGTPPLRGGLRSTQEVLPAFATPKRKAEVPPRSGGVPKALLLLATAHDDVAAWLSATHIIDVHAGTATLRMPTGGQP